MAIQLILLKQNPNGVVRENGAIYMFIYYNIVDIPVGGIKIAHI